MKSVFCLLIACFVINAHALAANSLNSKFKPLEKSFDGKIGVYAINTGNQQTIAYHANTRFPVQSTFKLLGVAALLKSGKSLQKKIHYTKKDLVPWHPVTGKYVNQGMTLNALAEATMRYSDNPAINLIMRQLGGVNTVTKFARSIGNKSFRVQHYEANLNSNPNSDDDSATPRDMAISLQKLTLGHVLTAPLRKKLVHWMVTNITGDQRIRAGVPANWVVADKTGSGSWGIANDIGIVWVPKCQPVILAIYTVRNNADAKWRDEIVASATRIVMQQFAKSGKCFGSLG